MNGEARAVAQAEALFAARTYANAVLATGAAVEALEAARLAEAAALEAATAAIEAAREVAPRQGSSALRAATASRGAQGCV